MDVLAFTDLQKCNCGRHKLGFHVDPIMLFPKQKSGRKCKKIPYIFHYQLSVLIFEWVGTNVSFFFFYIFCCVHHSSHSPSPFKVLDFYWGCHCENKIAAKSCRLQLLKFKVCQSCYNLLKFWPALVPLATTLWVSEILHAVLILCGREIKNYELKLTSHFVETCF